MQEETEIANKIKIINRLVDYKIIIINTTHGFSLLIVVIVIVDSINFVIIHSIQCYSMIIMIQFIRSSLTLPTTHISEHSSSKTKNLIDDNKEYE